MLHFDTGNPLLSANGELGREFVAMLDKNGYDDESRFDNPGCDSLLHTIQSDILSLKDRADDGDKYVLRDDDTSVQVHSCHSPMREVQVLYDRLLDLFEKDPSITPADIAVLTPDISVYAPLVQSVFSGQESAHLPALPFSIADRSVRAEHSAADAFLKLCALASSRFSVPDVFDAIDFPCVLNKFSIDEDACARMRELVRELRVCWGIDGESKKQTAGMSDVYDENSWRAAINRLLLGYAMNGRKKTFFNDTLPFDEMEGERAREAGTFIALLNLLFSKVSRLAEARPLCEWRKALFDMIENFIADDAGGKSNSLLYDAVERTCFFRY